MCAPTCEVVDDSADDGADVQVTYESMEEFLEAVEEVFKRINTQMGAMRNLLGRAQEDNDS